MHAVKLFALAAAMASCGGTQTTQDGGPQDASLDSSRDAADGGCPSGQSSCGGKCMNVATDNANCGGCGLTCAACVKGRCTTTIATPALAPWAIAVDSKNVYWTSLGSCASDGGVPTGNIASAPITGGPPVTLATGQGSPSAIAVDAKSIYWVNKADCSGNGSVVKAGLDGSGLTTLAGNQNQAQHIALDAANVYWTTSDGVMSMPLGGVAGGGAPTTLASKQGASAGVVVEGKDVLWAQSGASYDVNSIAVGGGSPKKLTAACGAGSPCFDVAALAADGTNVYWSPLPGGTYASYNVVAMPLGGGALNTLAGMQGIAADITTDGKNVYWTTYGMFMGLGDTVVEVPVVGGTPTTLASAQANPRGVAVDATSVYWANSSAGGGIMKVTPK
jgi:hypothetical protein